MGADAAFRVGLTLCVSCEATGRPHRSIMDSREQIKLVSASKYSLHLITSFHEAQKMGDRVT